MNRVPWALLGLAAGLFMIAMDPGPPGLAPLIMLGVLCVVGAAAAISTFAMNHALDQLTPVWTAGFVLALALGVVVFFVVPSRYHRSSALDLSFGTMGWMFVLFSLGFIAFALFRHVRPAQPMVTLSPAGLSFNLPWLKNLLIPWAEVEHVGTLEHIWPSGVVIRHTNNPVIVVSQDFHERHILPRRSFLSGNLWSGMFQSREARKGASQRESKAAQMQILLPWPWFSIEMNDMLAPVDARWKAFREPPQDAPPPAAPGPALRYGVWSAKAQTPWRMALFAVPFAGVLALLAHFAGVWDTVFLQSARELSAKTRQKQEDARRESQQLRESLERSGVKIGR